MWVRTIKEPGSTQGLRAMLDASGVAGTWDWWLTHGTVLYDAGAAEFLAGDPDLAGRELRAPEAVAAIHRDDVDWVMAEMRRAVATGNLILAEYRVVHPTRGVRWVLSRGRVHRSETGSPLRAHGILFDITENREEGQRYCTPAETSEAGSVDRIVNHCTSLRAEADRLGSSKLRLLIDMVLLEVGQRLARRMRN